MSNSEEELERKVKELQEQMKKDINDVCERFGTQMKKAFFDKLHEDFKQVPPKTDHIKKCIHELVDGLCKFVPTRTQLHEKIREEIMKKKDWSEDRKNKQIQEVYQYILQKLYTKDDMD